MDDRPRRKLTYANVMATLAVVLVITGGTALGAYVVTSNSQLARGTVAGHQPPSGDHSNIIPGSIDSTDLANRSVSAEDLGDMAKFRRVNQSAGLFGPVEVMSLGGLRVFYTCLSNQPILNARTTVDNADITLELTSAGSSFYEKAPFMKADHGFRLTEGNPNGEGTATYSAPNGSVVTLSFGFDSGTRCLVHGLAVSR